MLDNMLYGSSGHTGVPSSIGLFDIVLILVIFYFYLKLPLRQIDITCDEIRSYPPYVEDPVLWRQRTVKKYWKVPLMYMGPMTLAMMVLFYMSFELMITPPENLSYLIVYAFVYGGCFFLFFWPLKIWREAKIEQVTVEYCRQQAAEHRLAMGIPRAGDAYHYLHAVKKREFNRGFAAGQSSEWNNH